MIAYYCVTTPHEYSFALSQKLQLLGRCVAELMKSLAKEKSRNSAKFPNIDYSYRRDWEEWDLGRTDIILKQRLWRTVCPGLMIMSFILEHRLEDCED